MMIITFVVMFTVAGLPLSTLSFSFTKEPERPLVVVLNKNSTNVEFRWEFSLGNGDIFSSLNIERYEKDKQLQTVLRLGFFQVGYKTVNTTLYSLNTSISNGPSSGYVSFIIKDIVSQDNNKDGSKADVRLYNYVFLLELRLANDLQEKMSTVELVVLFIPESTSISIKPNERVFCNGSQVQINCTSRAKPPAVYSLYRNDTLVQNGSSSGYFNVALNKVGNYRYTCVPSNAAGVGRNKSTEVLEVKEPPKISNCENKATALEGEKFTFHCNISGSEPLTITWTDGTRVWNTKSLTFDPVNRRDAETYNLTVSNGGECPKAERKNMILDVYYKPEEPFVTYSPAVCVNQTINFTCKADAFPDVTNYTFFQGTKMVDHSVDGFFTTKIHECGIKNFSCIGSNTVGSGREASKKIKVFGNFEIVCKINNEITLHKIVIEKDQVTLECKPSGCGPYNFAWKKTGHVIKNGIDVSSLEFNSTKRTDEGQYEVTVHDELNCFSRKAIFNLTVIYKPEFTSISGSPNESSFCIGKQIEINCISVAKPQAVHSLYRNNELVRSGSTNGSFMVTLNNEGSNTYMCESKNTAGFGQNKSLHLDVKEPLKIKACMINGRNTTNATVNEETNVTLNCDISGSKPFNTKWSYGNQVRNTRSLIFTTINRADGGDYFMMVDNGKECNTILQENFTLTVNYKPESTAINILPDKNSFCFGQQIQINCLSDANPRAVYSLYRDKELFQNGSTSGSFMVTLNNEGANAHTCESNNSVGFERSKSLPFIVHALPKINYCMITSTTYIGENKVIEGDRVTLSCNVSRSQPIHITWTKGALVWMKANLTFQEITKSESGAYHVKVNDSCNKPVNDSLTVTVGGKTEFHFKLKKSYKTNYADSNSNEYKALKTNCLSEIKRIYSNDPRFYYVKLLNFVSGSVLVNMMLYYQGNEPLKLLIEEVNGKGVVIDGSEIERDSVNSGIYVEKKSEASDTLDLMIIVIIVIAAAVFVIIFIILGLWCYRKKKSPGKDPDLVNHDQEEAAGALTEDSGGRDNVGYSPSNYAKGGPPNAESSESAYATVDLKKKHSKKKPGEILYAQLEDFQQNGSQLKGSGEGIPLKLLPKDDNTKMPEKYEETVYAQIVGAAKIAEKNQGPDSNTSANTLNDSHTATGEKSHGEKQNSATKSTDSNKQDLHKPDSTMPDSTKPDLTEPDLTEPDLTEPGKDFSNKEKDKAANPTDNQAAQPPAKEDSAARC